MRKKRGKINKKIRYFHYCLWARMLKTKEVGAADAHYSYPKAVLDFIRMIAPGDIVGELREDAEDVELADFCDALEVPKLQKEN